MSHNWWLPLHLWGRIKHFYRFESIDFSFIFCFCFFFKNILTRKISPNFELSRDKRVLQCLQMTWKSWIKIVTYRKFLVIITFWYSWFRYISEIIRECINKRWITSTGNINRNVGKFSASDWFYWIIGLFSLLDIPFMIYFKLLFVYSKFSAAKSRK